MSRQEIFDVIVIGGGLAGCTAAYHLCQRGCRVLLLEQHTYPFHRLCGETLSPEVWVCFEGLGIRQEIASLKPALLDGVLVTTTNGKSFRGELPGTGLGLSRYQLDWRLWNHARATGVHTLEGFKGRTIEGRLDSGFTVSGSGADGNYQRFRARLVIGAYGKRSNMDRKLGRRFWTKRHGYVAFKAHFEGVDLGRCVELHGFRGGYCGLCHIEANKINLCLIVKESVFRSVGSNRQRLFDAIIRRNPYLNAHLDAMHQLSPKFLSIGQIAFTQKTLWESDVMMVGDAAQMITPLCGDGMAMAMRSAELCAALVPDYLDGKITPQQLKRRYCGCWQAEFRSRLRWGRLLQPVLFQPQLASIIVGLLHHAPSIGRFLIQQTRDKRSDAFARASAPESMRNPTAPNHHLKRKT